MTIRISRNKLYFEINDDYNDSYICVGYDTIIRIFMTKYYEKGVEDIRNGLDKLVKRNNKFIIAGRLDYSTNIYHTFNEYI